MISLETLIKVLREKDLDKHLKGVNEEDDESIAAESTAPAQGAGDYQVQQSLNYLKTMDILKK